MEVAISIIAGDDLLEDGEFLTIFNLGFPFCCWEDVDMKIEVQIKGGST